MPKPGLGRATKPEPRSGSAPRPPSSRPRCVRRGCAPPTLGRGRDHQPGGEDVRGLETGSPATRYYKRDRLAGTLRNRPHRHRALELGRQGAEDHPGEGPGPAPRRHTSRAGRSSGSWRTSGGGAADGCRRAGEAIVSGPIDSLAACGNLTGGVDGGVPRPPIPPNARPDHAHGSRDAELGTTSLLVECFGVPRGHAPGDSGPSSYPARYGQTRPGGPVSGGGSCPVRPNHSATSSAANRRGRVCFGVGEAKNHLRKRGNFLLLNNGKPELVPVQAWAADQRCANQLGDEAPRLPRSSGSIRRDRLSAVAVAARSGSGSSLRGRRRKSELPLAPPRSPTRTAACTFRPRVLPGCFAPYLAVRCPRG